MEFQLGQLRAEAGEPLVPSVSDVARFKESPGAPRVVADAAEYVVYALKGGINLRVLNKADKQQTSFKEHTTPVRSASFVTNKSNVVASASATELFVWYVDAATRAPVVYFEAHFAIAACAWILQPASTYPDLLCVRESKLHLLKASDLIAKFSSDDKSRLVATEEHFARLGDRTLMGAGEEGGPNPASPQLAVGSGGRFTYQIDAASVITCTARNLATPPWKPCGVNGVVECFAMLPAVPLLAAASGAHLHLWDIAAEPTPLFKIALEGARVGALCASGSTLVAFVADEPEAVVLSLEGRTTSCARFVRLDGAARAPGVCVTPSRLQSGPAVSILADFGEKLSYSFVDVTSGSRKTASLAPATPPYRPQAAPGVVPPAMAFTSPPYNSVAGQPPHYANVYAAGAGAPLIFNPALAGVNVEGTLSAALEQYNKEVAEAKARLDSALSNATQVVKLIPQQISRDAAQLTAIALEAQVAELQRAGVSGSGAAGADTQTANAILNSLMDAISDSVVDGVADAAEDAMARLLEPSLRAVLEKRARQGQRDALRKRIDEALKGVMSDLIAEFERRHEANSDALRQRLKEMNRDQHQGMQELARYVSMLEQQLVDVERSGLLEEVRALRAEVAALRSGSGGGAASGRTAAAQPPPETVVSTAAGFIKSGDRERGLQYALSMNDAEITFKLLSELDDDLREEIFGDTAAVADGVVAQAASQLIRIARPNAAGTVVSMLNQLFLDRASLARAEPLPRAVLQYVQANKAFITGDNLRAIKSLEIVLRPR